MDREPGLSVYGYAPRNTLEKPGPRSTAQLPFYLTSARPDDSAQICEVTVTTHGTKVIRFLEEFLTLGGSFYGQPFEVLDFQRDPQSNGSDHP